MKTTKKIIVVLLVIAIAVSVLAINASAYSAGYEIGQILGSIVFSPFLLIDYIVYIITGIHIFYW